MLFYTMIKLIFQDLTPLLMGGVGDDENLTSLPSLNESDIRVSVQALSISSLLSEIDCITLFF